MKKTHVRGMFLATALLLVIALLGCSTPVPTASPAPTSSPKPTAQPTPTASPSPTAKPSPTATAAPAGKAVTLKMVAYRYSAPEEFMMGWDIVKKLEERSKGLFKINYLGGAEVIPTMEQWEGLKRGVVDIVWSSAPYAAATVPEAPSMAVIRMTPKEMRASGFYDYMNDLFQKQGMFYISKLDPSNWYQTYQLFLNFTIDKPEDLKGRKIRTTPSYTPMLKYFGAQTVTTPAADVYTAIERGLVEGTPFTATALFDYGLQEVIKYYVLPGFGSVPVLWTFNLKVWNSLSPDMQKLIKDTTYEMEEVYAAKFYESRSSWLPKLDAAKLKAITLAKEPGQRLIDAYYDSQWRDVIGLSPVHGPKLRQLAGMPPLTN